MMIEPKIRGFICTASHPDGCAKHVKDQIDYVKSQPRFDGGKRVLVVGGSTGYGIASRIALAFGSGAKTLSVAFDKPPRPGKTATAGWYNTAAFERFAAQDSLWAKSLNGDAFSDAVKQQAVDIIKNELGQIDLLVYSIASPVRVDPKTGVKYSSVIKPVAAPFTNKTIDVMNRVVSDVTVQPATEEEIKNTVAVMGGDDWRLWVQALAQAGVLAPGFQTLAYSYIGPSVTHPIYRDGTIGAAKKDLVRAAADMTKQLAPLGGGAYVSVNKAVVTQASSAIPVVPLYISILFRIMKQQGLHEGCIEQMFRLFASKIYAGGVKTDEEGLVRVDDREMLPEVQQPVGKAWAAVSTANLDSLTDLDGYIDDFHRLFGFRVPGVDYAKDTDELVWVPSIPKE